MVVSPRALRGAARRFAPPAMPVTATSLIPYDQAVSFTLRGAPGNIVEGVINVGVDGVFVATAIGYGFEEERARDLSLPLIAAGATTPPATFRVGDITLGDISSDALIDGFRLKASPATPAGAAGTSASPLERISAQEARNGILEKINTPADISFFFSMVDSSSGRELQDEPVNNLASLGRSDGERPFRLLPKPLSFAPRSTLRLQVIENSEGVQGTLFIVLYGYKILAPSHCPEPIMRSLHGLPGCPTEIIGLPSERVFPYDYVGNLELLGQPQRFVQQDININVEGGFIATSLGYALATDGQTVRLAAALERIRNSTAAADAELKKRLFNAFGDVNLNAVPLALFGTQALQDGIHIRPGLLRVALNDGGRLTSQLSSALADKVFESINRAEDVSFRYTILDSSTGRELQNGLINNIAGLGSADGVRPFKTFARPMIFLPRSAIRVVVQEHFGRGRLFLVFQGYKLAGTATRGRR